MAKFRLPDDVRKIGQRGLSVSLKKPRQPQQQFRELFHDVQMMSADDSKRFVDAIPIKSRRQILKAYETERHKPGFDLIKFLSSHFVFPSTSDRVATADQSISQHITALWPHLTRHPKKPTGSLMKLPHPYIVPGGRFDEMFYWDSYFIALGLQVDGRHDSVKSIARNMMYQLRYGGFIPTANRSYFMTRSQPPYFSRLIRLLEIEDPSALARAVPYMVYEYRFWMRGRRELSADKPSIKRVVRMPDGTVLNRYYDELDDPRPESYPHDIKTAEQAIERQAAQVYLDVRAAAESGWDFSSRWFSDSRTMETIQTTDLVAVDLNCLLYELEMTIARGYRDLRQKALAKRFEQAAKQRARSINHYLYSDKTGFYYDYDITKSQLSTQMTMAAVYPLSSGIASRSQAKTVMKRLQRDFLKPGGLVTTLVESGQQWDAPNGWAPLQWEAVIGLRRYGYDELADEVRQRFISGAEAVYLAERKLVEKYNVLTPGKTAVGGEYALQDGFGWTNGVMQAFLKDLDKAIFKS